ncbi:PKD domain-containing protein [Candidatus Woesearchaeota archaeon]|nr:PKD domain-containing protein [Candidatus Woesearchaeota archaeon]
MKKIIFFILLFTVILGINVFAFPELEYARWAKNYESSVTIRNTETASFFYTISSSNAPVSVSIYVTNSRYEPLSRMLTQTITKEDFEKQGYIYSNGELKLGYTSGLITIDPNDYELTEGNYKIQIEIIDEKNNERNSVLALDLIVTKSTDNKAPTAVIDVFPSKTVKIGTPVTLSGLNSYDEDGLISEYIWSHFSGYETFEFDEKESAIIVTPTKEGFFSFTLKVKDNEGLESSLVLEEVRVVAEISEDNQAPIANAGQDLTVEVDTIVTLDGSLSYDPEGDKITHLWKQIDGENVVLSGITTATPSFLASKTGEYVFELTVMDSNGKSSSDQVKVTVLQGENKNPVALFNIPAEARTGTIVQFDASQSYDDGKIVEYKWETNDETFFGKVASYVFTVAKEFIVKLTVTDDKGATSTLEKVINIRNDLYPGENLAPIANAGLDQSVSINSVVTLDGSLSYDPEGDKLSYIWTQMEGSLVKLEDAATKNPRFTPKIEGRYKFSLVVVDNKGLSSQQDEVMITVLPKESEVIPPEEEISREIHKFTVASAFIKENEERLDVYVKVRNRGNNREDVIISATILPTGEYASTRTIAEMKENSYEVLSLSKPQESGSYIVKIDISNRKDRDVYYLPLEV